MLINCEDYVRYLHELRACSTNPNKLVACAFDALSDDPIMAAVAARAVCYVDVISISIYAHKHLAGRLYTRRVNDAIIAILEEATNTGELAPLAIVKALKEIEPDWTDQIDAFVKKTAGVTARVHAAASKYPQRRHYSVVGYAAMAAVLTKHLDRDCIDSDHLRDAFVTSCQLESFFAVIDDVNRASNYINIVENRGQAMAIKSHTFMTADERLRQEVKRRKKGGLPVLTEIEALAILDEDPLAGWCTLTEDEKEYLYLQAEKSWYRDCRLAPGLRVESQKRKRLERKREQAQEKETSDRAKRAQFAQFEKIPVYTTMLQLEDVLQSMYPAAGEIPPRPMYSTTLKTAIVREQLNVRKWVYGRKFPPRFLDSGNNDSCPKKLSKLKKELATVMADEAINPPIKKKPLVRSVYQAGVNPTAYRASLDAERNNITRQLEAEFAKHHPAGVFKGETAFRIVQYQSALPYPPSPHPHIRTQVPI